MSPMLITGLATIFLAFVAYTSGVVSIERRRRVTRWAAAALALGLAFDATATACMVAIASGPLTLHGWIGIAALAIMTALVVFAWRHHRQDSAPRWLRGYARVAYLLWMVAFVMGIVLGASR